MYFGLLEIRLVMSGKSEIPP